MATVHAVMLLAVAACTGPSYGSGVNYEHGSYNVHPVPVGESSGEPDAATHFYCSESKFSTEAAICTTELVACERIANEVSVRGANDPVECEPVDRAICFVGFGHPDRTICAPTKVACDYERFQAERGPDNQREYGECVERRPGRK